MRKNKKNLLIIGASGLLGRTLCEYFTKYFKVYGIRIKHPINITDVQDIKADVADTKEIFKLMNKINPTYVIYAAGISNVDNCEKNKENAYKLHVEIPEQLTTYVNSINSKMVYISTDQLWDGKEKMIKETKKPEPMNVYARTKSEGERRVILSSERSLIIRTNFFGPGPTWRTSISDWIINSLRANRGIKAFHDIYFTPISTKFIAFYLKKLLNKEAKGIFNLVGSERISKYEFARKVAGFFELPVNKIERCSVSEANLIANRPRDMSLSTKKISSFLGEKMPSVSDSIKSLLVSKTKNYKRL